MNYIGSVILFCLFNFVSLTLSSDLYLENDSHFSQFCDYLTCSNFATDDFFVLISKSKIFENKRINFKNANIDKIPKNFFNVLPKIEFLEVNNCQLLYFGHSTFEKATRLQILNLDDNRLEYILEKNFFGARNLEWLSLEKNEIIELAETAFYGLKKLEHLSLSANSIIDLRTNLLSFLPNLKFLNFSYNQIQYVDNNLLSNNTKLEIIDISYNNIKSIQEKVFSNIPLLRRLDLSKNAIKMLALDLQRVGHMSVDNNMVLESFEIRKGSVKILSLHSNAIRNIFVARPADLEIVNLIQNNLQDITFLYFSFNIKHLNLSGNKLKKITRHDLKNMQKLEILILQFNDIRKIDPDAFKSQKQLQYLDISYNNLRSLYVDILINCPKIQVFNFNGNFLGCKNLNYILLEVISKNIKYKQDKILESNTLSEFATINDIYCKRNEIGNDDSNDENLENLKKEINIFFGYKQMKIKNIENSLKHLKEDIISQNFE